MRYEKEAEKFVNAIRKISDSEEHLNNLESYLTDHFQKWLDVYAGTPEGLAAELDFFANIEF